MDVRGLLRQWNIRPSKGLGQNFIIDQAALNKIVAAAELTRSDTVLEIGAGLGTLTERLAREAGHVAAVELDERLIPVLQSMLSGFDNVTLIQGDILALDPAALVNPPDLQSAICNLQYKVVANLPYYITSAVLRHLLEARARPQRMVVTVQREVAERIVARPGEMSLLAVSVQFYGRPQVLFRLRPGSFYPSPEVEAAVGGGGG
jgi:16S rRNA (adenine1518-N6/adenine1519-N6)-dimethyltransferase